MRVSKFTFQFLAAAMVAWPVLDSTVLAQRGERGDDQDGGSARSGDGGGDRSGGGGGGNARSGRSGGGNQGSLQRGQGGGGNQGGPGSARSGGGGQGSGQSMRANRTDGQGGQPGTQRTRSGQGGQADALRAQSGQGGQRSNQGNQGANQQRRQSFYRGPDNASQFPQSQHNDLNRNQNRADFNRNFSGDVDRDARNQLYRDGQNRGRVEGNRDQFSRNPQDFNRDRNDFNRDRDNVNRNAWQQNQRDRDRDWNGDRDSNRNRDDWRRNADRIRNDWRRSNRDQLPFRYGWWDGYAGVGSSVYSPWRYDRWRDRPYYWWGSTPANRLTTWFVFGGQPTYWTYGSGGNIYYRDNYVYYDNQRYMPVDDYYKSLYDLAHNVPQIDPNAAEGIEWSPLGVFAVTRQNETDSRRVLQLAVNRDGVLTGTYLNQEQNKAHPLLGRVDERTQRAAWAFADGESKAIIFETSIYNLTQAESTMMVHFGPDASQTAVWNLVRLEQPSGTGSPQISTQPQPQLP